MGQVFEATEEPGGRRVAIKTLRSELASDGEMLARFKSEARALSTVKHPGLVQIYHTGTLASGGAYIAMEFLDGQSLRSLMKRRPLAPPQYLPIAMRVAETLTAVHAHNIVHRDLKPENIMLIGSVPEALQVKVLDFGIAKVSTVTATQTQLVTRAGSIFGTPTYMAPEQCGGEGQICDRTDVYALGVLLYELVTGKPPFEGETDQQLIGKHLFQEPVPVRQAAPQAAADLELLVHAMLAKQTTERPSMQTIAETIPLILLGKRLGDAQTKALRLARESPTVHYGRHHPTAPNRGRTPPWLLAVAAILILTTAVSVGLLLRRPPPLPPAPAELEVLIRSQPSGAQIIDPETNQVLGRTPYRARHQPRPGEQEVRLVLENFETQTVRLRRDRPEEVDVVLKVVPPPTKPPEPQKPKTVMRHPGPPKPGVNLTKPNPPAAAPPAPSPPPPPESKPKVIRNQDIPPF